MLARNAGLNFVSGGKYMIDLADRLEKASRDGKPDGVMQLACNELAHAARIVRRYEWLKAGNAYRPEEWGCTGGQQLDDWIDEELSRTAKQPV